MAGLIIDPDKNVGAVAALPPTQITPTVQPVAVPEIKPESLVENRMTGLLSKNNDFTKMAETGAAQVANSRGLQNSSMAVQAGRAAVIQSALPIAQQDAQTNASSGLSRQNYLQTDNTITKQGEISGLLQRQKAVEDSTARSEQAGYDMGKEQYSQGETTKRATMELSQKDTSSLQTTYAALGQQYEREYSAILTNPDFASDADKTAALTKLQGMYKANMNVVSSLQGVTITWT